MDGLPWCESCRVSPKNHRKIEECKKKLKSFIEAVNANSTADKDVAANEAEDADSLISPSGLTNLGNTCFMNSVLQCLFATKITEESIKLDQSCPIYFHLLESLKEMKLNCKRSVTPTNLFSALTKRWKEYKKYNQQDSHEFLRRILDACKDSEKQLEITPSLIDSYFSGDLISILKCESCFHVSKTKEAFLDLSVSASPKKLHKDEKSDLTSLLKSFVAEEVLKDEDGIICEKCNSKPESIRTVGLKRLEIVKAPKILVIHIKRFVPTVTKRNTKLVKDCQNIEFPFQLDLDFMNVEKRYSLIAVVEHQGSDAEYGHYVAYTKIGSNWYYCSDSKVKLINEQRVADIEAYILFYREE